MNTNVGNLDRIIRILAGLFLLSLIFWGPKSLWGLIGIVPLFTGLVSWCPLYIPLKVNTIKTKKVNLK